ncbi:MAG TPA: hypothetical protein VFX05_10340 [Casimicrobiaceae bacterium]|nr:hypothetical protein [Casimicrobiaceae bacterium]
MRHRDGVLVFIAALSAAPLPALALPCAGFVDIADTDAFCGSVTWMKNRNVTAGCTATTYCGADVVSRLQMAAFMFRVANVVTPTVVCQTADLPAVSYDRLAIANADFSFALTGQQNVVVRVASSVDGGSSWQPVTNQPSSPIVSGDATARQHVAITTNTLPHPIAQPNHFAAAVQRYGIFVVRGVSSSTQTIADWTCHLQVFLRTHAQ